MVHTLKRVCERRLRALQVPPDTTDIEQVVALVAAGRHRPIHLRAVRLPAGGPSGAWIASSAADYVMYEEATPPRHQIQIIGHELAHIICQHGPAAVSVLEPMLVAPGAASIMLTRSAYLDEQEQEAELLADMLVRRLERAAHFRPRSTDLERALQHRPRLQ